jgi:NTP pyrophosphatase (non-canonical NTP hydrolase)
MAMSPWVQEPDPMKIRRLGKTVEELGELIAVLGRCIIQGVDAADPVTGEPNISKLQKETADALTQLGRNVNALKLDAQFIHDRIVEKDMQMDEWEAMLKQGLHS